MAIKVTPTVSKEIQIKYREGKIDELHKIHRDSKVDGLKDELKQYKNKNLRLVKYLKHFNEVEEITDEVTKKRKK